MEAPTETTERIKAETDGYEPTEEKEEAARYITEEETRRGTKRSALKFIRRWNILRQHLTGKADLKSGGRIHCIESELF